MKPTVFLGTFRLEKKEICFNCRHHIFILENAIKYIYKNEIVWTHDDYDTCKSKLVAVSLKMQYQAIQELVLQSELERKLGNKIESDRLFNIAKNTMVIKPLFTIQSKING